MRRTFYRDRQALLEHLKIAIAQGKAARAHESEMQKKEDYDNGVDPDMNNMALFSFPSAPDGWEYDGTSNKPTAGSNMPALAHRLLLEYMTSNTD